MPASQSPIEVFYSYAHEDELFRAKLDKHLSLLRRQGLIKAWHDRQRAIEDLSLLTASTPRAALPPIWSIPYPPNPYFTDREELLSQLAKALRAGQTTALSQPQAISGLGGIGKTQIALEYAYRYHQEYQAVLWSRADTIEVLISGFVAFAKLLKLPQKDEKDQLIVVQAVKEWLETHDQWLLILDNADDLAIVRDFLPPTGQGHTLLTTRAASTGRLANRIEVEILDLGVGALFVLRRAGILAADASLDQAELGAVSLARELVQEMGGLPLALDQAGGYIEEVQCNLSDYLKRYHQYRAKLLKERGGLVADHPEPVATTWSLSFERIEKSQPAAADLLRVCAFLQPDAIPEEILLDGAQYLGQEIQQFASNPFAFDQALKTLLSYSLIRRNATEHLLSIHRLVQAVLKDAMDKPAYHLWAERTVQAIEKVLPQEQVTYHRWAERIVQATERVLPDIDHITRARYERCLPYAQGCMDFIGELHLISSATISLLCQTGSYLAEHARHREAEPFYQRVLEIREQALGSEHPEVAYLLYDLAVLYYDQGKYAQAEPLFQQALEAWEKVLGSEHPEAAYPLSGLADLRFKQGKYMQAESLYLRALEIREQALEPEPTEVAYELNRLANLYRNAGKYAQAEPLFQKALYLMEQALEPGHPLIAYPLHCLAHLYREQGKYTEAEALYLRALKIREQAFGPEHPQLAYVLNGLGILYLLQGKYEQAEPLFQQALHIWEQALGPERPQVAYALNGLADLYREQGKYEQAEPLYQRTLAIKEQQLGPKHPHTLTTRGNYASLLRTMGRDEEVITLEMGE